MNRKVFVSLLALLLGISVLPTRAEPPVVHESTQTEIPAIVGTNSAQGRGVEGRSQGGQGVVGQSQDQAGVVGVSNNFVGIWGESKSVDQPGVLGISQNWQGVRGSSDKQVGVIGESKQFVGVWGESKSPQGAGGEFHNKTGGDLIRAGQGAVFRVDGSGNVFVRGQLIGAIGPVGPVGPRGPAGPPGPAVRTVALCQSPGFGTGQCLCTNQTVTRANGACTVTSDTGSCSNSSASGCCAVCGP